MTIEMIVALIGASVVAYAIANRFRLIAPVLLIAAGVGVALLPVGEEMSLPSTVVLTIFLPILLYWESLSVSLNRMRRSLRGIILSATVLVAITAALITLIGVLTGLSVGAALLIGACLGPTDATAVSSLGRGINPNGRTVLQAESLLNDGTALVIFAIALQAAQDSSGVTAGLVAHQLLLSFGGGIGAGVLVGAAVTKIGIRVRTITDDPILATITALATPFLTFFVAEEIGGSGVLAVVTCGIVISRFAAPHMSLGSRVLGIPFWTILTHILNTILFVMVGVALPGIVAELPRADLMRGLILIPIIYIAMVAGRFAGQHLIIYSIRALDRRPEQRLRRTNIRGRIVSTVAGFRGAISLAMAPCPSRHPSTAPPTPSATSSSSSSPARPSCPSSSRASPCPTWSAGPTPGPRPARGPPSQSSRRRPRPSPTSSPTPSASSMPSPNARASTTTQSSRRCAPTTHGVTAP